MIEQMLRDYAAAAPGFTAVLLRYFNPIGGHASGLLGDDPNGIPNNLMPYIARVAAGKLERLTVFGDDYPTPDGTCLRDYLHVVDLAKGHLKALEYAAEHTGAEAFNLGTGSGVSVLELVHAFEKANGVRIPYVIGPRREGDLACCWADTKKAKEILGWPAEKSVEDMYGKYMAGEQGQVVGADSQKYYWLGQPSVVDDELETDAEQYAVRMIKTFYKTCGTSSQRN